MNGSRRMNNSSRSGRRRSGRRRNDRKRNGSDKGRVCLF
jgi:hypothetical protein